MKLQKLNLEKPYVKNFKIWTGKKYRNIAEPIPILKEMLKGENEKLLKIYEEKLKENHIENIPQAYRKNHNVKTNATIHKSNKYWYKFDFTKFFDSINLDSLDFILKDIYEDYYKDKNIYYDYFINPKTGGLTQGSPTSGTLAGLLLIPFWIDLKKNLPNTKITQYSDDLCISSNKRLDIKYLLKVIKKSLKKNNLPCKINKDKTKILTNEARHLTGVSCNNKNKTTLRRDDYRSYRAIFHALNKSNNKIETLYDLNLTPDEFIGRLSFFLYIDSTNKINKLIRKNIKTYEEIKKYQINERNVLNGKHL